MVSPVLVAIYFDTGDGDIVSHLVIDSTVDIEVEKQKWQDWVDNKYYPQIQEWNQKWYGKEYTPEAKQSERIEYISFENWLIKNCDAHYPNDSELIEVSI